MNQVDMQTYLKSINDLTEEILYLSNFMKLKGIWEEYVNIRRKDMELNEDC